MPHADLETWRLVVGRLVEGPAPRGDTFDLCRRLVAAGPPAAEGREAVRLLLEGAMADALTPVADAQAVMRILRLASRGEIDLADLISTK